MLSTLSFSLFRSGQDSFHSSQVRLVAYLGAIYALTGKDGSNYVLAPVDGGKSQIVPAEVVRRVA